MHFYLPEVIFSIFLLSGMQPRVAAVASDAIVWPGYVILEHASSSPCVVRLDEKGIDTVVHGPPSPFPRTPGAWRPGFETWNCYTSADSSIFVWRFRGVSTPTPPWRTAWCVMHHWCQDASFFVVRHDTFSSALIPWP